MSGLGEIGGLTGFMEAGQQAQLSDIDQLTDISVDNPSVSQTWFGTANGGTAASGPAIGLLNQYADWPRNACYTIAGVLGGTLGGTFNANFLDQFGQAVTENVTIPSAANGGTIYGSAIVSKFLSGTFTSQGSSGGSAGTAQIGFGTLSNGSAQSNWFGLLTKIHGTSDVKAITWINSTTPTTLNAGTKFGTLVGYDSNGSVPSNAFQGTSGVAATDRYKVFYKPAYDNRFRGTMVSL